MNTTRWLVESNDW